VVWGGIAEATAPRQDRTRDGLRSDERRVACACRGLDRRGRIEPPASHAGRARSVKEGKIALDKQHGIFEVIFCSAPRRRTRLSSTHFCQFAIFWAYGSHGAEHVVRTASATDQWFRLPHVFCLSRRAARVNVIDALPGVAAVV
jgi:hypothetical protein